MVVVAAFGTLANTINAGLTAYFRATNCTALTIADVIPLFAKITAYEEEYVIGEMKIWDTGSESVEPNNCAMVRVMVYNDGWIVAWFDKEAQNQFTGSGFGYVNDQTLSGFGTEIEYPDQWNGCYLKITNSNGTDPDDSDCPDGTIFSIRSSNSVTGQIQVQKDYSTDLYHFNTGNTYDADIYMSNGNLVWYGHTSSTNGFPTNLVNRLYRAIYEMWEYLRYSSNTTETTDTAITKAFLDDGGSFTNYTTNFNNDGINDVQLIPSAEVMNDAFYFGYAYKFNGLTLNIGTAGVGNTIVWEYWNGSAWTSLTVTDLTSGFTVLTNHIHLTDDTTNPVTSVNATDQATVNTLLNEIKTDYNAHRVSTTFHDVADTTNVVAAADATDLATSITLANEIKTDYNAHRSQATVHPHNDDENTVTSADGTDLATTITLANEIKGDYNGHLVATKAANTVKFTPPDSWSKCFVNSSEQYWIRSRVSVAAFTTQPLLTQGWVNVVADSLLYTNSNLGMYSFEDTSANYCLICGISDYYTINNIYFYNTVLPGKTIYNHIINFGYLIGTGPYTSAYNRIIINNKILHNCSLSGTYQQYNTNGYHNINIETYDALPSIQNVFEDYNNRGIYLNYASVLITS